MIHWTTVYLPIHSHGNFFHGKLVPRCAECIRDSPIRSPELPRVLGVETLPFPNPYTFNVGKYSIPGSLWGPNDNLGAKVGQPKPDPYK